MKINKFISLIISLAIIATIFTGCSSGENNNNIEPDDFGNDILAFKPVDCGIQASELYEYPFIGLTLKLSDILLEKINSREVFVFTDENYTHSSAISYAVMRFSSTTEEERAEETMSVDIFSWEAALEKVGAIGVYEKALTKQLDELTLCDTHEKIGESKDGNYEYYISVNSFAESELTDELKNSDITITEMHKFDPSLGYTAFSADRIDGVASVGKFSAEDIFGNSYTEDIFAEYDLTLVNVFATWCSPCVKEIPELEKLRQQYEKDGIKLGVVAVVLDAKTQNGIDEYAIDSAQTLYERSEANFPFLVPDDGYMNGRLIGIESVPESFFVDSNGNIVSDPYIGTNSLEGWTQIVNSEFEKLNGTK